MPGPPPRSLEEAARRIVALERTLEEAQKSLRLLPQQKGPLPGWLRAGVIEASRIVSPEIDVGQAGAVAVMVITVTAGGQPWLQVLPSAIELFVSPQLAVEDVRDATAATVVSINDEQLAHDAGGAVRTYSHISLAQGGTMTTDLFNTVSLAGGLGPGARISRRVGLEWAAAGSWAIDASFLARYHNAPSSVTLTPVVADSLNGGAKSVTDIDEFGFAVQVVAAAGAGFTINRWTASGGN